MSLYTTEKPVGGVAVQRVMVKTPSDDNLMEQIFAGPNVHEAWKRVKANKGAAGVDGIMIDDFPEIFRPEWLKIKHALRRRLHDSGQEHACRWTGKSFAEFKHTLKRLTGRSWFVSMDYRMQKIAEYVRGWMNYYGIADPHAGWCGDWGRKSPGYPIGI